MRIRYCILKTDGPEFDMVAGTRVGGVYKTAKSARSAKNRMKKDSCSSYAIIGAASSSRNT